MWLVGLSVIKKVLSRTVSRSYIATGMTTSSDRWLTWNLRGDAPEGSGSTPRQRDGERPPGSAGDRDRALERRLDGGVRPADPEEPVGERRSVRTPAALGLGE